MQDLVVQKSPLLRKVILPSLLINLLSLAVPLTVLQIYDRILPNQSYGTATLLISGALLAVLMEAFLRFVRSWILSAAASNTEQKTYKLLLEKLCVVSPEQLKKVGFGGGQEALSSVAKVKDWYSGGLVSGFIDLPFAIIFLALVYYIGGVLVIVPLIVWLITLLVVFITSRQVKGLSESASYEELQRRVFLGFLVSTLEGIKRQAVESRIYQQFKIRNQQRYTSKSLEEQKNTFSQECIQLAALATSVILVTIGSLWVLSGELTTGGLAACSILSGRAVAPLSALMGIRIKLNTIHTAKNAIEVLNNLQTNQLPRLIDSDFNLLKIKSVEALFFKQSYTLSADIQGGDIILIEADEAHIASFMLANLAGVDELSTGEVNCDGEQLNIMDIAYSTAFCHAKAPLIAGSILDNLCAFDSSNTLRVTEYAKKFGLDKVITKLPEGLETKIGHANSMPFSMGTVKRIALVAQFARQHPLIMLDRPDVSLDLDSLNNLASTILQEAALGRTIFLVSYHPQLVALATKSIHINKQLASEAA